MSLGNGNKGENQIMVVAEKLEYKTPSHMADAGAAPATVSAAPLIGTWKNINPSTRDIVEVVIAASGSGISVNVYGACSPTPCNWGSVAGTAYAANVSSSPAVAFSAQYSFSFAQVLVVGTHAGKHLNVQTFTNFTDGSGRSNLHTADQLAKS
jgi:hypothetical protein